MKYRCAGEVGALMGAIFYAAFGGRVNAFLLCATFEVMGLCEGFGAYLYSRRLTAPAGLRVDGAAGPPALGAKGFARDRLTPPGRVEGFRPG